MNTTASGQHVHNPFNRANQVTKGTNAIAETMLKGMSQSFADKLSNNTQVEAETFEVVNNPSNLTFRAAVPNKASILANKIEREDSEGARLPDDIGEISDQDAEDLTTIGMPPIPPEHITNTDIKEVEEPKTPELPKEPEAIKFTAKELMPLMDALVHSGYALEAFKIGSIQVVLRTRFTWEERIILKHTENSTVTSNIGYQRELNQALIAASLVQYGSDVFQPLNGGKHDDLQADFDSRFDFISSVNNVFSDIIQRKLFKFDQKQKYLIDHFDELMSDF